MRPGMRQINPKSVHQMRLEELGAEEQKAQGVLATIRREEIGAAARQRREDNAGNLTREERIARDDMDALVYATFSTNDGREVLDSFGAKRPVVFDEINEAMTRHIARTATGTTNDQGTTNSNPASGVNPG